ncbi:MAG: ABC transporter permease [Candidatus Heimdallarchaeota archaeon]|nr:ABC transporter permease [Candidatus Heimdallarchaeota archaeon]
MISLFTVPSIITPRRSLGVIISLIISSAIFVGSYSLIYSMQNVNDDFFGSADDIMVFYNPDATTPFTSNVPKLLENSFDDIEAVSVVSPEIFLPSIINDQPVYIRGVKYDRIFDLEGLSLLSGVMPSSMYDVLVGNKLAQRLGLVVHQTLEVYSITEEIVKVQITGIYESSTVTTDEILSSISVATSLSQISVNSYTHIRAKYDPTMMSESEILELATETNSLSIHLSLGNTTESSQNIRVRIVDKFDNIVVESKLFLEREIEVVRGGYYIEIYDNKELLQREFVHVRNSENVEISIAQYSFSVNFTIIMNNLPVDDYPYSIVNQYNSSDVYAGKTENGEIYRILDENSYTLILSEFDYSQRYNFTLDRPIKTIINLNETSIIDLYSIQNNSLFLENDFTIDFQYIGQPYEFYFNETKIPIIQSKARINASDGTYVLRLQRDGIELWERTIVINTSIIPIPEDLLFDYAHYSPGEQISFNVLGLQHFTSTTSLEYQLIDVNTATITLNLPTQIGFHQLSFTAMSLGGTTYTKTWSIIIDTAQEKAGWKEAAPYPVVRPGDTLDVWLKEKNETTVVVDIGSVTLDTSWKFIVPDNSSGELVSSTLYNVSLTYNNVETVLSFFIIRSYLDVFALYNGSGQIDLNFSQLGLSTQITDQLQGRIQLDLVIKDQNYGLHESLWELRVQNKRIQIGEIIAFPTGNNQISIKSLITGTTEIISFSIITDNSILPKSESIITSYSSTGRVSLLARDTNLLTASIWDLDANTAYVPIMISDTIMQLQPGRYNISFQYADQFISTLTYTWQVEVLSWQEDQTINTSLLSNQMGHIIGSSSIKTFKDTYIAEGAMIKISTSSSSLSYIRDIDNKKYLISVSNIASGIYTLDFSNGTRIEKQYQGAIVLQDAVETVNGSISISFTDMNLKQRLLKHNFTLGLVVEDKIINFYNNTLHILDDVYVKITLDQTKETLQYFITNNNASITISTVTQKASISILTSSLEVLENFNILLQINQTIGIGSYLVTFHLFNKNFNQYLDSHVVRLTRDGVTEVYDSQYPQMIAGGNYSLLVLDDPFVLEEQIEISMSGNISLFFPLLNWSSEIVIYDIPIFPVSVSIVHQVTGIGRDINLDDEVKIKITDFPVGKVNITVRGIWGVFSEIVEFSHGLPILELSVHSVSIVEEVEVVVEMNMYEILKTLNITFVASEDYLKEFLQGALVIIQIILFTQIIIILLVLFYNIIEISSSLTFESKREIKLFISIGASDIQAVFAYTKRIFVLSAFITLIGQTIAAVLIHLLVISNNTVFFGHQFIPEVFTPQLLLLNYLFTVISTLVGMNLSYNREFQQPISEKLNDIFMRI